MQHVLQVLIVHAVHLPYTEIAAIYPILFFAEHLAILLLKIGDQNFF